MSHSSHLAPVQIDAEDAERLLDLRAAVDGRHAAIAQLLDAAAAPGRPHELAGELAALAGFTRTYRPATRSRRMLAKLHRRRVGMLVATAAAALSLGGTAYAASNGQLPDPLQRTVHSLFAGIGVPGPAGDQGPGADASGSAAPSASPRVIELCRAWEAFKADPQASPLSADDRKALATAAHGEGAVTDFCRKVLDSAPASSPAAQPTKTGKPDNSGSSGGQGSPTPFGTGQGNTESNTHRTPTHTTKPSPPPRR